MPEFLRSELPVLARSRHHWIVLLRRPHLMLVVTLGVLLVAAVLDPWPMLAVFLVVLGALAGLRWQEWRAEWIILTRQRIIRVRGVAETTTAEASLRLDRISGAVLEQTVPGKILNYGSIELEAPGEHPDVRHLRKIGHPKEFYLSVRAAIFGGGLEVDPNFQDDVDTDTTAPLPRPGRFFPPHRS